MKTVGVAALAAVLLASLSLPAAGANRGIVHLVGDRDTTSITPAGDVDTFVFDLPAGALLIAVVKAGKGESLIPAFSLVRPDDSVVPEAELAAAKYAPGKSAVKLVKFPIDQTGRWAIRVAAHGAGQTGSYTLQTKAKYPRAFKVKGVTLPQGGVLDVPVPLAGGTFFSLSLKRKAGGTGLSAPSLRQPNGTPLPLASSAWAVSDKGIKAKNIDISSTFLGNFTLRIPGPATGGDAVVDYVVKVKWPKRKGLSRTISSAEPVVNTVTPDNGNFGTQVQVGGVNFGEGAILEIGPSRATNVTRNISGTVLTGIVPVGSGLVGVTVVNPDGQEATLAGAFTYVPPPTVTSVTPGVGSPLGGTAVTVKGTNFRPGARVAFGTVQVSGLVTRVDSETLTLVTDPLPSGLYTVEVRDPGGQTGNLPGAFTVNRLLTVKGDAPPTGVAGERFLAGILVDLDRDALGKDDLVLSTATLTSDGAGGFLPATRVLRGNNNLTLSDATAGSFPGDFFPTLSSVPGTGLNPGRKDYGLAHASAMGDLDGDGDDDLVLCANGYFAPSNGWVLNNPAYPATSSYRFIPSPNLASVYYYLQYPGTRVLKNNGAGTFTNTTMSFSGGIRMAMPVLTQGIIWGEFFQSRAVALGDLDKDGDLDLVIVTSDRVPTRQLVISGSTYSVNAFTAPALRALANDGTGNFRFDPKFFISGWTVPAAGGESFQGTAVAVADLDGNTFPDVVVVNDVAPTLTGSPLFATRILLNNGSALVPSPSSLPAASALDNGRGNTLVLADINGDGFTDILVATPDALQTVDGGTGAVTRKSSVRIFRNDGAASFSDITATALPAATAAEQWRARGMAVADIDRDGDLDIVLSWDGSIADGAGGYLPSTRVLLNNGAGVFTPAPAGFVPAVDLDAPSNATPRFHQAGVVLLGDLDGDGDRDVILATDNPMTGVPAVGSRAPALEVLNNR